MLFAQTDWLLTLDRAVDRLGLPLVMLLVLGAMAWKTMRWLAPKIERVFERHLAFLDGTNKVVSKLDGIADMMVDPNGGSKFKDHFFSTVRTNQALIHYGRAMRTLVEHLEPRIAAAVKPHLDAIEEVLAKANHVKS